MLRPGQLKKGRSSGVSMAPQESPSLVHRKQRLQRIVIVASFVTLVISVTEFRLLRDPAGRYDIDAETVATQKIQADFAFDSEVLEVTREKRDEAAASVPSTYGIDDERVNNQLLSLRQRITILSEKRDEVDRAIREAMATREADETDEAIVDRILSTLAESWKADPLFEGFPEAEYLKTWVAPDLSTLRDDSGESETAEKPSGDGEEEGKPESAIEFANMAPLTRLAQEGLRYVLIAGVRPRSTGEREVIQGAQEIVIIREDPIGDLERGETLSLNEVPYPVEARERLRRRIEALATTMQEEETVVVDLDPLKEAAFEMAKSSIADTLMYNPVVTEGNRELERSSVEPVMQRFDAGQILQEIGYRWTDQARHDVKAYWEIVEGGNQRTRSVFGPVAANMIFVALLLLAFTRAMPVLVDKRSGSYTSVNVCMLLMCGTLILGRIISSFEPSGFLVPIAASAMLLTILTNPRMASMTTLIIGVLVSIQYEQDWRLLMTSGAMAFTGIVSLYTVRKRTDMARAAVRATLMGVVMALAITLASGTLFSSSTLDVVILIGLNGITCLFIVPGLLSPLERLFGITTDIQLLEYSDLNNELLSRLAIEVPATYAHSLMMGQLAEAAADAIGANGLMSRVCAYYHDVGKLRRPEYFSENQTGYNIHEELSPRLSARAIASHVTEGVEIAREFHLPQPIIRGILEHHGTLLISFFYQQALDQQKHGDVREEDFRYPGPKPQSPETAILMICDGVESGVRTIKNPNEERIREFVTKIVQTRSADRQFDECDLTLKKLDTIAEVVTKRIMITMHTRVAYPERPSLDETNNVIRMTGGRDT